MPVLAETAPPFQQSPPTVYVTGGGGAVQHVPWNLPPSGDVQFGDATVFGAFGLTDADKRKLAERIRDALLVSDVQAILEVIATDAERQEIAALAVSLGADPSRVQQALDSLQTKKLFAFKAPSTPVRIAWGVLATASFAASVYHGYKRNSSVGWAIWWGVMGALFPVITPTIAVAQGFGKPKHSGFGRAYRRRSRGSTLGTYHRKQA